MIRIQDSKSRAQPPKVSPLQNEISPSKNLFARPNGTVSPAAGNPFARHGAAINPFPTTFSSPPQTDKSRVSTASVLSRGGNGIGAYVPPENQVSRRGIRTADSASSQSGLPEVAPKSQLAYLKSSINNGNGMNAPKRRSSKGNDAETSSLAKPDAVPALEMKHSRSDRTFSSSHHRSANGGSDLMYSKESPRSNENTPRRLDPLLRRRPSDSGGDGDGEIRTRLKPPLTAPAMAVSQVVSQEYSIDDNMWQCKKCHQINPIIPGVDYCDNCAARRGATGQRGVSSQVMKYD